MTKPLPERKKTRKLLWFFLGSALLYLTGMHSEIIGNLQRILLKSSYYHPEITYATSNLTPVNLDFQLKTLDNKLVDMKDLKGKVIFLKFWATWSPPCIAEMPNIQSLFQKTKADNIAYILVAMDKDVNKVARYLKRKGYTFPVYQLVNTVPGIFESASLPATFVISPDGKIVTRKVGMASYDNDQFIGFLKNMSNGNDKKAYSAIQPSSSGLIQMD